MKIKLVPIEKINPAKYNPRTISDEALSGLVASLKKFGFVDPLVVNQRSGNLVSGHQRLAAARILGFKDVPVFEVDLSDSKEKALNITLNNQGISGSFTDKLQDILLEIKIDTIEFADLKLDFLELDIPEPKPAAPAKEKMSMIVVKCKPENRDDVHAIVANALKGIDYAEVQ